MNFSLALISLSNHHFGFIYLRRSSIFLIFSILLVISVNAQRGTDAFYPPTITEIIVTSVSDGLGHMEAARNQLNDATKFLGQRRIQYWSLYPDQDGFKEAEANLRKGLFGKDLFYLTSHLNLADYGDRAWIVEAAIGQYDNGLWPGTEQTFKAWVAAYKAELIKNDQTSLAWIFDPSRMTAAIQVADKEYKAYSRARDRAEFVYGLQYFTFSSQKNYTLALIAAKYPNYNKEDVLLHYDSLTNYFDEPNLLAASLKVMESEKNAFGYVKRPRYLGPFAGHHPYDALIGPLAEISPEYWTKVALSSDLESWNKNYSKEGVIEAARELYKLNLINYKIEVGGPRYEDFLEKYGDFIKDFRTRRLSYKLSTRNIYSWLKILAEKKYRADYKAEVSLNTRETEKYCLALLKNEYADKPWTEILSIYYSESFFYNSYTEKEKQFAIQKLMSAELSSSNELLQPSTLGVNSSKLFEALEEFLEANMSTLSKYNKLNLEANPLSRNDTKIDPYVEKYYRKLQVVFSQEEIDYAVNAVWNAKLSGQDPLSVKGNVSGFEKWEHIFGDILFSSSNVEHVLRAYHSKRNIETYFNSYGKEVVLEAFSYLMDMPMTYTKYNGRYRLPENIEDPTPLGIRNYGQNNSVAFIFRKMMEDPIYNSFANKEDVPVFEVGQKIKILVRGRPKTAKIIDKQDDKYKIKIGNTVTLKTKSELIGLMNKL